MTTAIYLKFESPSVAGDVRDPQHDGEIEILSWSQGFSQPASPTRSGTIESARHQNFGCSKYLDRATNELLRLCWSGKQIGRATLSCYRSSDGQNVKYLEVVMQHVVIANYSVTGGPGDVPVENLVLDYGVITYNYHGFRPSDSGAAVASATYDRETPERA